MRGFLVGVILISCLSVLPTTSAAVKRPPVTTVRSAMPSVSPSAAPAASGEWAHVWENVEGWASWYSTQDAGVVPWTANAEWFNDRELTCAFWGVPFNSRLKVTNLDNGRSVIVRVNDRGPSEELVATQNRVIDLTKTAFAAIADPGQGLIRVRVELARSLLSSAH